MREIKFRAWDEKLKTMVYTNELVGGVEYDCHPVRAINIILNEDDYGCVFMQYTGLKDRNDKEIYEGDILKNNYGDLWVVVWKGTGFMLALNGESKNIYSANEYYFSSCEVIGNIYEHPNLLEAKGNE